jgi:hypothetical protein
MGCGGSSNVKKDRADLVGCGSSSFGDKIVAFDDKEEARAAVAGLETVSSHKPVCGWAGTKPSSQDIVPGQKLCVRRVSVKFEVLELEDPDDFESIDLCDPSAIGGPGHCHKQL